MSGGYGCKCRSPPLGELTALPKCLSWIEGHFEAAERERKGEEGMGKGEEGKGTGTGENIPEIHFLVTALTTLLLGHSQGKALSL